jgi:N-hydroxyarylamine O-acetyltransferase
VTPGAQRPHRVDLDAYLQRLEHGGSTREAYATLEALHLAHATHIPFENLDVLFGRPIQLDADSLQRKLVDSGRGGYCYEQNSLFAMVLEDLGFAVRRLAARVRYRTTLLLPRTHMLLLVETEGRYWIADVGFGAEGLLLPVPLASGIESRQFAWTYRVIEDDASWVMQSLHGDAWLDLYSFTLERQEPVDFEVLNYYTSTHPNSRFVNSLIAQRPAPDRRLVLHNRDLSIDTGERLTTRTLAEAEVLEVLESSFGVRLPEEARGPLAGSLTRAR